MFQRLPDNIVRGVLQDFDLPTTHRHFTSPQFSQCSTFFARPFHTSFSFLTPPRYKYIHDLESFLWVLSWFTFFWDANENRIKTSGREYKAWHSSNSNTVEEMKLGLFPACRCVSSAVGHEHHDPEGDLSAKVVVDVEMFLRSHEAQDSMKEVLADWVIPFAVKLEWLRRHESDRLIGDTILSTLGYRLRTLEELRNGCGPQLQVEEKT